MKFQLNKRNRKGFTLIELLVVITILAALAGGSYGIYVSHMKDGDRQAAMRNMGSVYTALTEFRTSYSSFPCDKTAEKLQPTNSKRASKKGDEVDFGALTGNDSNSYFRQLFYKNMSDEKLFYAKASNGAYEEGDGSIANGKCLEAGENAFAYVVTKGEKDSHDSIGNRDGEVPLLLCGTAPSSTPIPGLELKFDMNAFDGHAFMVTTGGSTVDLAKSHDWENDDDDLTATKKPIFPESKRGKSTAEKYLILNPLEK